MAKSKSPKIDSNDPRNPLTHDRWMPVASAEPEWPTFYRVHGWNPSAVGGSCAYTGHRHLEAAEEERERLLAEGDNEDRKYQFYDIVKYEYEVWARNVVVSEQRTRDGVSDG